MDAMLEAGRFRRAVVDVYEMDANDRLYQYWMHNVQGVSFEDYKAEVLMQAGLQSGPIEPVEQIITRSNDVLKQMSGGNLKEVSNQWA